MAQINLRSLRALDDYSNAELKLLGAVAPAREYQTGDELCQEGDQGHSCYLVATGQVDVVKVIDNDDRVLATLRAGSIVGQMALVDRSPRSATLRSSDYTVVLELTRDVFERLLKAHSPLALRFQQQIAVAGIRQLRMATTKLATVLADAQKEADRSSKNQENSLVIREKKRDALLTVQAALAEWDMSLDELDQVHVSVPVGQSRPGDGRAQH